MGRNKNKRKQKNKNEPTLSPANNHTTPTTVTNQPLQNNPNPKNPDPLDILDQVQQTANTLARLKEEAIEHATNQHPEQNTQNGIQQRFTQLETLIIQLAEKQEKLNTQQDLINKQIIEENKATNNKQNIVNHQKKDIKAQETIRDYVQEEFQKKQAQLQDEINKFVQEQNLSQAKKESFANHIKNQRKEIQALHDKIDQDSTRLKDEQQKLTKLTQNLTEKQKNNQKETARFHEVFHTLTLHQRQIVGQQDLIENQQKQIDSAKETLKKQREKLAKEQEVSQIIPAPDAHLQEKFNQLQAKYTTLQDAHEKTLLDNSRSNFDQLNQEKIHHQEAKLKQLQDQVIKLSHMHKHDLEIILTLEQDLAHQHKQIKMLEVTPVEQPPEQADLQQQKEKFKLRKKRLAKAKKLLDNQVRKTRKKRLAKQTKTDTAPPLQSDAQTPDSKNAPTHQQKEQDIHKQTQMLTQVQSFLNDSEVKMRSRWATTNAITTITGAIIAVGFIAILAIYTANQAIPNTWQSNITLRLAPKNSPQANDPQWLNAQKEILYAEKSINETLNHLNQRGHHYFASPAQLRTYYQKSLKLTAPTPGLLNIQTRDNNANKTTNILKSVAASRISYENAKLGQTPIIKLASQTQLAATTPQMIENNKKQAVAFIFISLIALVVAIFFILKSILKQKPLSPPTQPTSPFSANPIPPISK